MEKRILLSEKELTFVLANLIIAKMIFAFPRNLFNESGNAAWIEAVFVSLIWIVIYEITLYIYHKKGILDIFDLAEGFGGKILKVITAIVILFVLTTNFVTELRTFSESVKIVLLPNTNIEYIMLLLGIAFAIGTKKGLSALATVNAVIFPVCLVFLGAIAIFLVRNYNLNNLFPFFGTGIKKILSGGIKDMSCFSDILVLYVLLPHAKSIDTAKSCGKRAILISAVVLVIICLSYGMCYPYYRASEFLLPIYQLSRMIRAGEYFQRFEAFFEFVWTVTELSYGALYVFVIADVFARGFEIKNDGMLSYSVSAICILLSLIPESVVENIAVSEELTKFTMPCTILLPFLIGVFSRRRKDSQ